MRFLGLLYIVQKHKMVSTYIYWKSSRLSYLEEHQYQICPHWQNHNEAYSEKPELTIILCEFWKVGSNFYYLTNRWSQTEHCSCSKSGTHMYSVSLSISTFSSSKNQQKKLIYYTKIYQLSSLTKITKNNMIKKNPMLFFMPHITNFFAQSLLIEDRSQDINGGFAFSTCLNGTFPWRKCSLKVLAS